LVVGDQRVRWLEEGGVSVFVLVLGGLGRGIAPACVGYVPRSDPDVDVLDLDETFCVDGCVFGSGD
jgi:hypothetical protein